MKKLLLFCALMLNTSLFAQLTISTNLRQDAIWNVATDQWDVTSIDSSLTVIDFNKELTSFHHTTISIASDYAINEWDYNDTEIKYTMKVTSDAGNAYDLIIDGVNNCVCFFYWYNDQYYLVRHTILESYFQE